MHCSKIENNEEETVSVDNSNCHFSEKMLHWSAKVFFVLQAAGFYIGDTRVYPNKDFVRFVERYESGEFAKVNVRVHYN